MAKRSNGHASVVIVLMPDGDGLLGIPIVRDPTHSKPLWKFPGGKGDENETGAETASRELEEETGIDVPASSFQTKNLIGSEKSKKRAVHTPDGTFVETEYHLFYPYYILLPEFRELKEKGDEGEAVFFAHIQDILLSKEKFLADHYHLLIEFLEIRAVEMRNFFSELRIDFSKAHPANCAYAAAMQDRRIFYDHLSNT